MGYCSRGCKISHNFAGKFDFFLNKLIHEEKNKAMSGFIVFVSRVLKFFLKFRLPKFFQAYLFKANILDLPVLGNPLLISKTTGEGCQEQSTLPPRRLGHLGN